MAGAIAALVAEKRAVGCKYDAGERVLARFAAFSASQSPGLDAPTLALTATLGAELDGTPSSTTRSTSIPPRPGSPV